MKPRNKFNNLILLASLAAAGSVGAATTTITGTTGGNNSWNDAGNWDTDVPSGSDDAIIGDGVLAIVDSFTTPSYSGTLTVGAGSTLRVLNNPASDSLVPIRVSLRRNSLIFSVLKL